MEMSDIKHHEKTIQLSLTLEVWRVLLNLLKKADAEVSYYYNYKIISRQIKNALDSDNEYLQSVLNEEKKYYCNEEET